MHAALAPSRPESLELFQPMVTRIARQLASRLPACVELDDIVQAGMIGLMDAAERFREDQGAQFETFASQRVRGAMLDELRQNDWAPRSVRRRQRDIDAAVHALQQRHGRAPTEPEIAGELGVTLREFQAMHADAHAAQMVSAESPVADAPSLAELEATADAASDPLGQLEEKRLHADLVAAIESLPERERIVMGLYYDEDLTFREIAAVLGVTESRVCQLHTQVVGRLRARLQR